MYQIVTSFEGANLRILSQDTDGALIDVDLRDTVGDWFYWCFRVDGAAGTTLTFRFPSTVRVGYFGAAVSHDGLAWHWQYADRGHEGDSFTYTFAPGEDSVYFAHDILYRPAHWDAFTARMGLTTRTLCTSERGRSVPYLDIGCGEETILLTARHHACEATGSYVLEGVLEELLTCGFDSRYRILCVPFVDCDGVTDGDQGKNRNGHDHNRDYLPEAPARYASVREIRGFAEKTRLRFAFDFHSPWHIGGHNDTVFIPIKHFSILPQITRLSRLWEEETHLTPDALPHRASDDMQPNQEWNAFGAPCFGTYTGNCGAELAFTVETPYFLAHETPFSPDAARRTGRCLVRALVRYMETRDA